MALLPWDINLEDVAPPEENLGKIASTYLQHCSEMNIHGQPSGETRCGVMCQIEPANMDTQIIQRLITAGLNIVWISLKNTETEVLDQMIQSIRRAMFNCSTELQFVYPLAVVTEIHGPEILTGDLKTGPKTTISLHENSTLILTADPAWQSCGDQHKLYVSYPHIGDLQEGDSIFIDTIGSVGSKQVSLSVETNDNSMVQCRIKSGGIIGPKMTVRILKVPMERANTSDSSDQSDDSVCPYSLEERDKIEKQVVWAILRDVDALLLPSVDEPRLVRDVRQMLSNRGAHILILAGIQSLMGLDNLEKILQEADGIYLDRNRLSNDLPIEKLFIAQKKIIAKCNMLGKPVICKAVISEQMPALSVTDLANMVLDGADVVALEMHYDSPLQKFAPGGSLAKMAETCIAAANVVCRQAERVVWQEHIYKDMELTYTERSDPSRALSMTAVQLSVNCNAVAIICLTTAGRTPRLISHLRPHCTVLAVTRLSHIARQLQLWRGISTLHYFEKPERVWSCEVARRARAGVSYCRRRGLMRAGDAYVAVTPSTRDLPTCDVLQLCYVSAKDDLVMQES